MHIISTLLFVFSANLDNLAISIAYGMDNIKINKTSNLIIALVSGLGTFISMLVGKSIINYLSPFNANLLGCVLLISIGCWFIIDFIMKNKNSLSKHINKEHKNTIGYYSDILSNPAIADKDNSSNIDIRESLSLSIALALNNFALGFSASITGLNIYLTSVLTFIFSFICIIIGHDIGKSYFSKLFGKYSPVISGLIIILLGIYEIFI